jgi:hypothetical protein
MGVGFRGSKRPKRPIRSHTRLGLTHTYELAGALQEKSVRMEEFGLASMYAAFWWS